MKNAVGQNSVKVFNFECKFNPCPIDHVYACNLVLKNQILKKSNLKPKIVQFLKNKHLHKTNLLSCITSILICPIVIISIQLYTGNKL